jgi:hypothetical protein
MCVSPLPSLVPFGVVVLLRYQVAEGGPTRSSKVLFGVSVRKPLDVTWALKTERKDETQLFAKKGKKSSKSKKKRMRYHEDAKDFAQSFHVSVELKFFVPFFYLNFPFPRFLVVSCRCRVFAHRAENHEMLPRRLGNRTVSWRS